MQRKQSNLAYKNYYREQKIHYIRKNTTPQPFGTNIALHKIKTPKKKKISPLSRISSALLLLFLGLLVIPYGVKNIVYPLVNYETHPEVKTDTLSVMLPTSNYLYNSMFLNRRMITKDLNDGIMLQPVFTEKMTNLENSLINLSYQYKTLRPSIFVWEYDTGKYVDINADDRFSAASIIKIPVLLETFKAIEAGELSLDEKMNLTEYYRSEGSGKMKYHQVGNSYTIDNLARVMIEQSDNTATNMLIAAVGGMPRVNSAIKSWGISNTHLNNWLPDLEGTNYTTTKDLAIMLYNIENTDFISNESKNHIFDYMGHVENNRLLQAGLPEGAKLLHKTGDIGKTLGDSGIVTTSNGKRYIVSIIVDRPYNSPLGKNFIVKASNIIYNTIASGNF